MSSLDQQYYLYLLNANDDYQKMYLEVHYIDCNHII